MQAHPSGKLVIKQRGETTNIIFRQGSIINAECGHCYGFKALVRISMFSEGTFEFISSEIISPPFIDTDSNILLLEVTRHSDEISHFLQSLPLSQKIIANVEKSEDPIISLLQNAMSVQAILDFYELPDLEILQRIEQLLQEKALKLL